MSVLRVVSYLAVCGVVLVFGIWIGTERQQAAQEAHSAFQEQVAARGRSIAVVSLDEGVQSGGGSVNYAQSVIEALGPKYKVLSYQQAQHGLSDGAYDAVLVFPADFSQKVSSIDMVSPQKAQVDYQINEELPEAAYIETMQNVVDFQNELNDSLGYMYVVSLYGEIHAAQEHVAALLANGASELEATNALEAYDFRNTLNLGDLPLVKIEFEQMDFDPFVQQVNAYASEMNKVYFDSYQKASTEYGAMATQLAQDVGDAQASGSAYVGDMQTWMVNAGIWHSDATDWQAAAEDWRIGSDPSALGGVNKQIQDYRDGFDGIMNDLQQHSADITDIADNLYLDIDVFLHNTRYFAYTNAYRNALNGWRAQLETSAALLNNGQIATVPAFGDTQAFVDAYQNYDGLQPASSQTKLQDIWDEHIDASTPDPLYPDDTLYNELDAKKDEIKQILELPNAIPDIGTLNALQGTATGAFADFVADVGAVETTAKSYDPLAYLTEADKNKAEGIVSGYATEIEKTRAEFVKGQTNDFEKVSGAYTQYSTHVAELRQAVYEAYGNERDQVDAARDAFVATSKAVNEKNNGLVGAFASKLPNSKNGQSVNQKLAEFVASPVALSRLSARQQAGLAAASGFGGLIYILYVCLAALALSLLLRACMNRRAEKKEGGWKFARAAKAPLS